MMQFDTSALAIVTIVLTLVSAKAEPMQMDVVLTPTDSMRMEFADGSRHFVLIERREGVTTGRGVFDGARIVEYGWHDVDPPNGGDPLGYIEVTTGSGDIAYLKWHVRAVFMGGSRKGPPLVHGIWELVSGTGMFAAKRGLGALQISPGAGPGRPERRYSLQGDVSPKP